MTKRNLYIAWGVLFCITAGIGFIPNPEGMAYFSMVLFALVFFIPPTVLLTRAIHRDDKKEVKRIFFLCLTSLCLTLLFLVLNFLSVSATQLVGNLLYGILTVVSAPMVCGQIWVLSLFLWGCLLTASGQYLWKKK